MLFQSLVGPEAPKPANFRRPSRNRIETDIGLHKRLGSVRAREKSPSHSATKRKSRGDSPHSSELLPRHFGSLGFLRYQQAGYPQEAPQWHLVTVCFIYDTDMGQYARLQMLQTASLLSGPILHGIGSFGPQHLKNRSFYVSGGFYPYVST